MKTTIFQRVVGYKQRTAATFGSTLLNVSLWVALTLVCSSPGFARTSQQEQARQTLGSLTSLGEVYINDSPTPVLSAASSGDKIRTGETGEVTLRVPGKGTLKIQPLSQIVLSGNEQYAAELERGTILVNSVPGPDGLSLRVGNFVVVPPVRSLTTALRITRGLDGSFQVYCLDGKVGVLTLEGSAGKLLEAGQSVSVSAKSELLLATAAAPKTKGNSHTRWILLGLAAAGAAGAAAALGHGGGGNHTVTLSAP